MKLILSERWLGHRWNSFKRAEPYSQKYVKTMIMIRVFFVLTIRKKMILMQSMEPQIGGKELANNRKAPQDDSSCDGNEVAKILVHGATL